MTDFNVKITVRNNRILRAIKDLGFASVRKFAAAHSLDYQRTIDAIGFRLRPISHGEWSEFAFDLSSALHCEPEDLWPDHMRNLKTNKRATEFSTDEAGVRALAAPTEKVTDGRLLQQLVAQLPERTGYVLASRFGLVDGRERSFEEVASSIGLTRERVRQIEAKGMRHIKDSLYKKGIKSARAFIEDPPSPNT